MSRWRISLIVPLILLVVALLETIVMYKVRQHVHDVFWRTVIVVVLTSCEHAHDSDAKEVAPPRVVLHMIDTGHEPRVQLRRTVKAGTTHTFRFTRRYEVAGKLTQVLVITYEFHVVDVTDGAVHV